MNWRDLVRKWEENYGCERRPPLSKDLAREVLISLDALIPDLLDLYTETNGLYLEWLDVLPIENSLDIKRTWDGIRRANDLATTRFLWKNEDYLRRFFVFAAISGGNCAVIDRRDRSLWYQENNQLHQTDLPLDGFIETMLREVAEL